MASIAATISSSSTFECLQILKLVLDGQVTEVERRFHVGSPSPATLSRFLLDTRLAGQFHAMVRDTELENQFSESERQSLEEAHQRQDRVNRRYLELLCQLRDSLTAKGIELLVLKGLFLAVRFCGGMDRRFMWDADIMVHPHHVRAVIEAARELGLSSTGAALPTAVLDRLDLHALEVSHRGKAIDIHWCFRNRPGYRIDYDRIRAAAQPILLDGQAFCGLSDEDALAFALLEIAGDIERSHLKIRGLWDLYLMLRSLDAQMDWGHFLRRRQQEGVLRIGVNVLAFCLFVFDCEDEFPGLSRALARQPKPLLIAGRETALAIIARPRQHLANRILYARLQPRPAIIYWAWWFSSAPLRFVLSRNL